MDMTYLFILFVIAVALAPLSHFVPSKRQREIARLREYAAVHGLFVEFRALPGARPGRSRESAGKQTIYYGRRLPASRKKSASAQAWLREGEAWRALERSTGIPEVLRQMPLQVLAASADENSCGAYWRESGGVEVVEQIRQALEAWSGQLRG
jgi:hypothetical protein